MPVTVSMASLAHLPTIALCSLFAIMLPADGLADGAISSMKEPSSSQIPPTEAKRAERIADLKKQRDRIREELLRLQRQSEGISNSAVPRSELTDQPTRTTRESLESVPGVAIREDAGRRAGNLSIRGSGQ